MNVFPLNIGHRGASAYAPENTIAAFDLALTLGADALELDVQVSADGELVVIHDAVLGRTTRGNADARDRQVYESESQELFELDAGSWFNDFLPAFARPEYAHERVPRLDEIFGRYGGRADLFIEVKHPLHVEYLEEKLLELVRRHDLLEADSRQPQIFVKSFSQKSLQRLHHMDERLSLIQLFGAYATSSAIRTYLGALPTYCIGIGPCAASVDQALAAQAARLELAVYPWTVNDPGQMKEMLELGSAGVVSDFPDVLDDIIRGRLERTQPPAGLHL